MKIKRLATLLAPILGLVSASADAGGMASDADIDQAVIAQLLSSYGIHSKIVSHIDLTEPFGTKSQWTLVVGKQPDEESGVRGGALYPEGAVSVCFVKAVEPDCSDAPFLEKYRELKVELEPGVRPFYTLLASRLASSRPGGKSPLVEIKACTTRGGNGSCGISTFLFAYDRKANRFRAVFSNFTGSNNNQATRFVESGPLLGRVISVDPTHDAPFRYFVQVYKQDAAGNYTRILKYRSRTGYADGNPLPVIDSEMPEILRRFGFWRKGDALPVPPVMPEGCSRLAMRKGVEWCASAP